MATRAAGVLRCWGDQPRRLQGTRQAAQGTDMLKPCALSPADGMVAHVAVQPGHESRGGGRGARARGGQ